MSEPENKTVVEDILLTDFVDEVSDEAIEAAAGTAFGMMSNICSHTGSGCPGC